MSLITYVEYNEIQVPILTIPKGTVLFRSMQKEDLIITDFFGINNLEKENEYCLSPYHNVYFYTYPYVIDTNRYAKDENKMHMVMYMTTTDVKVVLLLKPSPYTRHINEKAPFFTECDKVQFCGTTGKNYDKCLLMDFMEANPDVCGMVGIQAPDTVRFNHEWRKPYFEPFRKFITYLWDAGNMRGKDNFGTPEIALYPHRMRNLKEVKTVIDDSIDKFDYIMKRKDKYNYIPFQSLFHRFGEKDKLYDMLISMFSPNGYKEGGVVQHLTIDRRTYFYMLYEETEKKNKKYLVDIKEPRKLSILQKQSSDFQLKVMSPYKFKQNKKYL
jgi:hypothetical protein